MAVAKVRRFRDCRAAKITETVSIDGSAEIIGTAKIDGAAKITGTTGIDKATEITGPPDLNTCLLRKELT